jgi:hypothetical protein
MANLLAEIHMKSLKLYLFAASYPKTLMVIALLAGLSACGNSGVEVTTEFGSTRDVKEGAKIYFESHGVGQVIGISEQGMVLVVTMLIDQQEAARIDSQAAVVVNRMKLGAPLEIYASASPKAVGLIQGQQLKGLDSMLELVAWSVGDAIQAGSREISGYADSFQEYLQGETFQADRARVEEGVKEMAAVATETMRTVEQDLAEAMSEISLSEEELAAAILELGDQLSPVAGEMAKSGTDLMAELEKFSQGIDNSTAEEQASGQKLIESLIATIDKLDRAAERGAQSSVDEPSE